MKSYREIADSVFARRDQYIIQQRKKKQAITRVTASVGSVALVSLAGFALLRSDVFRDTPPITDSGITTTTAKPTENSTTTKSTATTTTGGTQTTATSTTTASTVTAAPTTSTEVPSKTEPTTTATAPTTAPTKKVIGADQPDTNGADTSIEGGSYFRGGEISPMLKEAMEKHEGEDVVFAVLVAVKPPFSEEDMDKAVREFCETEEMRKLAEDNNWKEYDKRVFDFKDAYRESKAREEVEVLSALSEFGPIKLLPDPKDYRYNPDLLKEWPTPPLHVMALARYSIHSHHIYSVVLSADAINEFAERGTAMFWLDTPDEKFKVIVDE